MLVSLARSLPLQHAHGDVLRRMFTEGFFDYTFMIVRDPLERMKSEYRHARGPPQSIGKTTLRPLAIYFLEAGKGFAHYSNNHFMPRLLSSVWGLKCSDMRTVLCQS